MPNEKVKGDLDKQIDKFKIFWDFRIDKNWPNQVEDWLQHDPHKLAKCSTEELGF